LAATPFQGIAEGAMADSGISQTATLEEQEAYLVRLRGRYTQFLNKILLSGSSIRHSGLNI
jgi:hypothetical protein